MKTFAPILLLFAQGCWAGDAYRDFAVTELDKIATDLSYKPNSITIILPCDHKWEPSNLFVLQNSTKTIGDYLGQFNRKPDGMKEVEVCEKCGLIRVPPEKISEAPDLWIRASSGTITLPMPMPIEDRFKNTHPKYYCHNCGKWWEGGDTRISCAVYHSVGDCCHYGQTEVKP